MPGSRYVRFSDAQLSELIRLWRVGRLTILDLARRFGVSTATVADRLGRSGVTREERSRRRREIFRAGAERLQTGRREPRYVFTKEQWDRWLAEHNKREKTASEVHLRRGIDEFREMLGQRSPEEPKRRVLGVNHHEPHRETSRHQPARLDR